jgi:hypothetical protein
MSFKRKPESRVNSLVLGFRLDKAWTPVFTPGLRHSGAGLVTTFIGFIHIDGFIKNQCTSQKVPESMDLNFLKPPPFVVLKNL